jgi:uncharacterized protein
MKNKLEYISPWIQTTNRCNLSCKYCYHDKSSGDMSKETFLSIISKMINIEKEEIADRVALRLAGGEPLLVFENWKDGVDEFLNKSNLRSCINIISNLTIIPDGFIEYIDEHPRINLNVSLDGINKSKPYSNSLSSSKDVIKNIDKINKPIYILTVINPDSIDELPELAKYIGENKFAWRVSIDYFYQGNPAPEIIIDKLKECVNILVKNNYPIEKFKLDHCDFNGYDEGCMAGTKLFAINIDGGIYPCHTLFSSKSIANINDDINLIETLHYQKCYKIGNNHEWDQECQNCVAFRVCHGDCQLYNNGKRKKYFCKVIKHFLLFYSKLYLKEVYGNA